MSHFNNIQSLADLKKQFRTLALANHPDRGGDTKTMQAITAEFTALFNVWKNRKDTTATANGYENDYSDARTGEDYSRHVYEEYGWTGKNYNHNTTKKDIVLILRDWLKKTYPGMKCTINRRNYNVITVHIMTADFNPFAGAPKLVHNVNVYWISEDKELNDRGRDVVTNIVRHANSYNFDHSDMMTDYHHVGFYFYLTFGSDRAAFKVEIPRARRTGGEAPAAFRWKDGPAHAAIKKVLKDKVFGVYSFRDGDRVTLGQYTIYNDGPEFYPMTYSQPSVIKKVIDKLNAVGILCHATSGGYMRVIFDGYTPETERALAEEDRQRAEALRAFEVAQAAKDATPSTEEAPKEATEPTAAPGTNAPIDAEKNHCFAGALEVVEYSDKAVALFGDTKALKDQLKAMGGRFNPALRRNGAKCAGWIFSKTKTDELEAYIAAVILNTTPEEAPEAEPLAMTPAEEHALAQAVEEAPHEATEPTAAPGTNAPIDAEKNHCLSGAPLTDGERVETVEKITRAFHRAIEAAHHERDKKLEKILTASCPLTPIDERIPAHFAIFNKNNTLNEYRDEVRQGRYYTEAARCTQRLTVANHTLFAWLCETLLSSRTWLEGTGGTRTDDPRFTTAEDFYQLPQAVRQSFEFYSDDCIVVNDGHHDIFIIDAQGYKYARYVGLVAAICNEAPKPKRSA